MLVQIYSGCELILCSTVNESKLRLSQPSCNAWKALNTPAGSRRSTSVSLKNSASADCLWAMIDFTAATGGALLLSAHWSLSKTTLAGWQCSGPVRSWMPSWMVWTSAAFVSWRCMRPLRRHLPFSNFTCLEDAHCTVMPQSLFPVMDQEHCTGRDTLHVLVRMGSSAAGPPSHIPGHAPRCCGLQVPGYAQGQEGRRRRSLPKTSEDPGRLLQPIQASGCSCQQQACALLVLLTDSSCNFKDAHTALARLQGSWWSTKRACQDAIDLSWIFCSVTLGEPCYTMYRFLESSRQLRWRRFPAAWMSCRRRWSAGGQRLPQRAGKPGLVSSKMLSRRQKQLQKVTHWRLLHYRLLDTELASESPNARQWHARAGIGWQHSKTATHQDGVAGWLKFAYSRAGEILDSLECVLDIRVQI